MFPEAAKRLHWGLRDPAATPGSDEDKMQVFRAVRNELMAQVEEWTPELFDYLLSLLAEHQGAIVRSRKSQDASAPV